MKINRYKNVNNDEGKERKSRVLGRAEHETWASRPECSTLAWLTDSQLCPAWRLQRDSGRGSVGLLKSGKIYTFPCDA